MTKFFSCFGQPNFIGVYDILIINFRLQQFFDGLWNFENNEYSHYFHRSDRAENIIKIY